MIRLTLYGTLGCHLCEEAEALLDEVLHTCPETTEILRQDIADDSESTDRYGTRIPVLREQSSGAELGWPFDADRLRSFLQDLS